MKTRYSKEAILKRLYVVVGVAVILTNWLVPASASAAGLDIFNLFTPNVDENQPKFPLAKNRAPLRTLRVAATAYSSEPRQTDDSPCRPSMWSYDLCAHFLSNGEENSIAANFLSLGTKVRFPDLYGDKIFIVRDRMNERYNLDVLGYYKIDFYKIAADDTGSIDTAASRQKALDFGFKRNVKMEILGV